jgi:transcription elongation GreA/GreB family factor
MNLQTYSVPRVGVGSIVSIRDLQSQEVEMYTLTSPNDADIRQNCISTMTPIGRALYGRRTGDIVEFEAPAGTIAVEIEAVESNRELQFARDG